MNYLVVFVGGGFGALVRYIICLIVPKFVYLPTGTLLANFLGCFIATFVFIILIAKSNFDSAYKVFIITGFCGGLSTLSAFSLEMFNFIQAGEYVRALVYTLLSIVICTLSVILGVIAAKHFIS